MHQKETFIGGCIVGHHSTNRMVKSGFTSISR